MNQLSRRTKILIAFFVMVVGGGALTYMASVSRGVSPAFIEARMQGALIAQGIVDLSQKSTNSLEEINKLDREGSYPKALEATNQLIAQNKEIKEKAIALSKELETMTKALDSIKSEEARDAALRSISSRLAMISRLIQYSDSLAQLLETLKLRFSGVAYGKTSAIKTLIGQINGEVSAINNFDREARTAMDQFDTIINKGK
jgi:vacuolar-type H+-ATPase subunit I/STV1